MKLTKEQKTNLLRFIRLFCFATTLCFTVQSCKEQSLKTKITGKWRVSEINWSNGTKSNVPENEQYYLKLTKKGNQFLFKVDAVSGTWNLDDSLLIFKNIPESRTHVDSIFVENDAFGNSSVILKNGNQLIATITNDGIEPEKVTSVMKLIYVDRKVLHLSNNGDIYIYKRLIN